MIAPTSAIEPDSSETLPNSSRVYVEGEIHEHIRVPMRQIELAPTRAFNGAVEVNEPVKVYDTSGPWGDPAFDGDIEKGLPALRREWILKRGDAAEYQGRNVRPEDNGYLSVSHAQVSSQRRGGLSPLHAPKNAKRKPLRASAGHPVTQRWYAREGIITPEMEFIAIRENLGRAKISEMSKDLVRNDLDKQHAGRYAAPCRGRRTPIASATCRPSSTAFRSAFPPKSLPNSFATRWPPAGRSSRPISITPNASR